MDDLIEYLQNKCENFDLKRLIFPTIIILLYVASFVYFFTILDHNTKEIKKLNKQNKLIVNDISNDNKKELDDFIYVDVKGSVANPGVYKLNINSRVIDAVTEAGGVTKEANTRFINLSKLLNDGDVVMVYSSKEISDAQKENIVYIETPCICEEVKNDACLKEENESENTNNIDKKININTASLEDLKTLDGIGDQKAKAIIDYRNKNGNFKTIEEITKVSGISETLFIKIKENITI